MRGGLPHRPPSPLPSPPFPSAGRHVRVFALTNITVPAYSYALAPIGNKGRPFDLIGYLTPPPTRT